MGKIEFDEDTIRKVADLAKLELSEQEIKKLLPQLRNILEAFSEINQVNTEDTELSIHPVPIANHLREDIAEESLSQEDALKNSPTQRDGYFRGPRPI